jgi:hypothetical protein
MQRHPINVARHAWTFFRTGGLSQVAIETAEDLLALPTLDQKLWVALSCPTKGIDLDPRTLELIDTDRDGFIRVPEVLHAVEWSAARLKNPAEVLKGNTALELSAINDALAEDRVLTASAREILKRLGKASAATLSVDDFTDPARLFPSATLNGDGVLAPSETDDPDVQQLIKDIIACTGGEKDRTGADGVTPERARAFFDEVNAYLAWIGKTSNKDIAVFGEHTAAACSAVAHVRAKVEDFFARCRLAAFDARATAALNRQENEYLAIAAKDLTITSEEIAGFPLARVAPDAVLPLFDGCNPAWAGAMVAFHRDAVTPMFGEAKRALTAEEWHALNARLAPYETWLGDRGGACIEQLGIARAKAIQAGDVRARLDRLFADDKQLQPQFEAIASVERLVRYHRDLRVLLQNFVNFSDFYSRDLWAVFQAGKLYLDSRTCELCIRVEDPAAHAALAAMSKAYIAYLDCRRNGAVMHIAACFTQGDSDYLFVGRNGVFYDRKGDDWQATITKIIDNPISLREAFWSPYKKAIRAVEEQVAKRASTADAGQVAKLSAAALPTAGAGTTPPPPPPTAGARPPPKKMDLSTIIGLSVAIGSIGGFLASVFGKFVDMPAWEIPLVVIALMLVVSLPSMLIAWLKLRQRNLGPILEANGWAINGRVKINVPFGTALTERAKLPPKARVRVGDPYANQHAARNRFIVYGVLAVLFIAAIQFARTERTWPFSPAAEERSPVNDPVTQPVRAPEPKSPPEPAATPAKK